MTSSPPPPLEQKSFLSIGLGIVVAVKHPGVSVGLDQGSFLNKENANDNENDNNNDNDNYRGNGDCDLVPKLASLVIHRYHFRLNVLGLPEWVAAIAKEKQGEYIEKIFRETQDT